MKPNFLLPKLVSCFGIIGCIVIVACNDNSESETTDTSTLTSETTSTAPATTATPAATDSVAMVTHAEAKLSGTYPDTTVEGTVRFDSDSDGKVKMMLDITIPRKAGKTVALHIHEHGNCGDKAMLAHGHWNPTNTQHGKWGSGSFHSGDIGNVKLNAQGKGTMTLTTDLWTLGGKPDKNILGKSMIVHGGADDYKTQPTGNSGTRIGCAVIQ
ncbi:MAG TPA: superoxide dismutase family protein [Chitinophagaceae bacterium]|nr:superoxide dismutase family protein [Chitinophagaceae bacterium]